MLCFCLGWLLLRQAADRISIFFRDGGKAELACMYWWSTRTAALRWGFESPELTRKPLCFLGRRYKGNLRFPLNCDEPASLRRRQRKLCGAQHRYKSGYKWRAQHDPNEQKIKSQSSYKYYYIHMYTQTYYCIDICIVCQMYNMVPYLYIYRGNLLCIPFFGPLSDFGKLFCIPFLMFGRFLDEWLN